MNKMKSNRFFKNGDYHLKSVVCNLNDDYLTFIKQ